MFPKVLRYLFLLIPALLWPVSGQADNTLFSKSVLVIHSYHKGMQWVEDVESGLEKRLLTALGDTVDIKVEYLDSKRFGGDEYSRLVTDVWRHKYKNSQPDCLIVCDDNGLNLLLSVRDEIFPGVPIVFCGINLYEPERFASIDNITGVVEAYDLTGTLNIIRKLQPDISSLFIINDDTTSGVANRRRLEEIQYGFGAQLSFIYSGVQTIEELKRSVARLSDDTAVLLMSFNRDSRGRVLRYRDAVAAVHENSNRPVFGVWRFYLGRGIVGGSLVDGVQQGESAANLCLRILGGTPAADLPVITKSPNRSMFDYRELKRFGISLTKLGPDAVVLNRPASIWHTHRTPILIGLALFIGQSVIIFFLVINVRKRVSSEKQLKKSRQNLETTLSSIDNPVVSVDSRYRIVEANHAIAEILGVPLDDLAGCEFDERLRQQDPAGGVELAEILMESVASGQTITLPGDFSFVTAAGRERRYAGTCSPLRANGGKAGGVVLILRDVTEQENMQQMLAQSQKMEAIGQLAGGVAHDFNNLLTGISGFAELLSLQLGDDTAKRDNALRIVQAAGRARDLTRQLLSFARKGKIVSSVVDCHESLGSAIALLERSLDKSVVVVRELEADNGTIVGDPVQLENIFINIGINGADAMVRGGTLRFHTANVVISEPLVCEFGENLEEGEYLMVSISDTGLGMSPDVRESIFEPFFTTKETGKGTGLGLSAVFGAMKEHNGRIRLISEVGCGTEFQLYFPIDPRPLQVGKAEQNKLRTGGETILVIDDEELVLSTVQQLLEELGYHVLMAGSGQQGVELFRKERGNIDLVLLDMIMPGMDGVECYRLLKGIDSDVKVVICSGFAKTSRVKEVERLGAIGFLQKPYTASEVTGTLARVFA